MQKEQVWTDDALKEQVRAQLLWDSRVAQEGILVNVEGGKVILSGTVPTFNDRLFAEQSTRILYGVQDVANRLLVSFPKEPRLPTDEELKVNIESLLKWSSHLDADSISVVVLAGHVTLSGSVSAFWKIFRAEQLATEIQGVAAVTNKLAIVPTRSAGDEAIAKDIIDALTRDSRINVETVDVKVEHGKVTLAGLVRNMEAYWVADRIATYTFGVVDVENMLSVHIER